MTALIWNGLGANTLCAIVHKKKHIKRELPVHQNLTKIQIYFSESAKEDDEQFDMDI